MRRGAPARVLQAIGRALWPRTPADRTQLIHTLLGTFVGAFLGAFLALTQAECDARQASLRKLELVRREAEANWDTARRIREATSVDPNNRGGAADRISLAMASAALQDERVVARIRPETLSLLEMYVRTGSLLAELQDRYNSLIIEWAAVVPGNVPSGSAELADSVRYNAAAFAASSFVLGEELAKIVDISAFDDPRFARARQVLERRVREVTQGVIDGRAEPVPKVERLVPSERK